VSRLRATLAGQHELLAAHAAARDAGLQVEEVFSPVPLELEGAAVSPMRRFVLAGGIGGALGALALTIGTALYWPLMVSGKPIVSMPPFLIIVFEVTVLFAALTGLAGFLAKARLPAFAKNTGYVGRFAEDAFGLVVACAEDRVAEASGVLVAAGAIEVEALDSEQPAPTKATPVGILLAAGLLAAAAQGCGLPVGLPTDMVETPAVHHDEELRVPAAGTLHRDGEVEVDRFLAAMMLQNPLPRDDATMTRGQRMFAIYCTACHGAGGRGDGPVAEYFAERPPTDLTSTRVRNQTDGYMYATLRNGGGNMPAYGHAISPEERWAIVHFVRTLQEPRP